MYQPGIFALGATDNVYIEFDLLPETPFSALVTALANLSQPLSTLGKVNLVIALRPSGLRELAPNAVPADAADFDEPVVGKDGYRMPATQHDAWIWISGPSKTTVYENANFVCHALKDIAKPVSEEWGWQYKESRDLTGFVDGTENPGIITAPALTLVPSGENGADGCILLYQKWRHEVQKWLGTDKATQESAIGRTKDDDEELDPKPEHAHAARTVIEKDGIELKMFRRNVAYGGVVDHGTLFVGFSQDQFRQAEMLRRMAGVDGIRDLLTEFAVPLTGAYYVVPALETLAEFITE